MTTALSEAEIKAGLAELDGWSRDGDALVKEFRFDDYLAGLAFASSVGVIAEGLDHHPDLNIGWRRVAVSFTTHDAGNKLTAKDFAAAKAIDALGYPRS
ncbi:MAG: 4a-hydroxytetrahydrobiopterin dehydratase [Chloroflexi bacterium]|nr:4a-hydroxytetrahydrobiopterin dehydratase [Chloroflexota bacterium]